MDLKILQELPPWEWPESAGEMLMEVFSNNRANASERVLAAELAGGQEVENELS